MRRDRNTGSGWNKTIQQLNADAAARDAEFKYDLERRNEEEQKRGIKDMPWEPVRVRAGAFMGSRRGWQLDIEINDKRLLSLELSPDQFAEMFMNRSADGAVRVYFETHRESEIQRLREALEEAGNKLEMWAQSARHTGGDDFDIAVEARDLARFEARKGIQGE